MLFIRVVTIYSARSTLNRFSTSKLRVICATRSSIYQHDRRSHKGHLTHCNTTTNTHTVSSLTYLAKKTKIFTLFWCLFPKELAIKNNTVVVEIRNIYNRHSRCSRKENKVSLPIAATCSLLSCFTGK